MARKVHVTWNPTGSIRIVERLSTEGAQQVMREVFQESQNQVPKDSGSLRDSGELRVHQSRVTIAYTAEYAGEQHENLYYRHNAGEKAKYLEDPFNDIARTKTGRIVAKLIDEGLK
jgi:hypothetical protein